MSHHACFEYLENRENEQKVRQEPAGIAILSPLRGCYEFRRSEINLFWRARVRTVEI